MKAKTLQECKDEVAMKRWYCTFKTAEYRRTPSELNHAMHEAAELYANERVKEADAKWISVDEKWPTTTVLLLTASGVTVIGCWYEGLWRIDGRKWEWTNGQWITDVKTNDITHWQPLPAPPTKQ
jgi:hypothetical protein